MLWQLGLPEGQNELKLLALKFRLILMFQVADKMSLSLP